MLHNILLDKLPQITPNGYNIKTGFKQGIKFELLMQDRELSKEEQVELALSLFYFKNDLKKIKTSKDIEKRIEDILWFYKCGKEEKTSLKKGKNKQKQIYSYEFDDNKIYSAFIQQYNIDLQKVDLHWWQFKSLFESLTEETQIVQIMGYRAMELSKIKDKDMKKHYKQLQEEYKLPDMRSEEEKEEDFAEALW